MKSCVFAAMLHLATVAALLAGDAPTPGVLIAAESFDYPAGASLDGASGGLGWDGGWFHAPASGHKNAVEAGSMVFPTLATAGQRMLQIGGDVRSFRRLDTGRKEVAPLVVEGEFGQTFGKEGTTLWISFLIAIKSWPQVAYGGIHLCDGLGDLAKDPFGDKRLHQRISLGRNNTGQHWYLGRVTNGGPGSGKWESDVRADDQVRFLVYRFDFQKAAVLAHLFIDPAPGKVPDPGSVAIGGPALSSFHFNCLSVGAGGSAQFHVDEIRLGTTFEVVAPSRTLFK